jgi:hypothetical protein
MWCLGHGYLVQYAVVDARTGKALELPHFGVGLKAPGPPVVPKPEPVRGVRALVRLLLLPIVSPVGELVGRTGAPRRCRAGVRWLVRQVSQSPAVEWLAALIGKPSRDARIILVNDPPDR